jgi:hypothetical protein
MSVIQGRDIWKGIESIKLHKTMPNFTYPLLFRYSLCDLNIACSDKLPLVKFNLDFHRSKTILSDLYSSENNMRGLFNLPLNTEIQEDGSGWIYLYTNDQELLNGKKEEGLFWWYQISYKCRIKIGITGRHPIQRIREQQSTGVSRLPLILGLLWTPTINTADSILRDGLKPFKAKN